MSNYTILAVLVVPFAIMAIVAQISSYREYKKLIKFTDYLQEVFRGLSIWFRAMLGEMAPRRFVDRADGAYAVISKEDAELALAYAGRKMLDEGLTLGAYVWRQNDCDDYALAKMKYIRDHLRENHGDRIGKLGIPVGMIGYQRDDGKPHQLVTVYIEGKRQFYEPYGEPEYAAPIELSRKEIGSIDFDIM